MQPFQPPGFQQCLVKTALGIMVYYTAIAAPWSSSANEPSEASADLPLPEPMGEGRPVHSPFVFLHSLGGGSSAYEWSKVYPAFAGTHRIIAPDLVGWGSSAHPPHDYTVDDYLAILTTLLEDVAQTPAIVAATSLTAGITLRLATQRPDLFRALCLVSPSGYGDFGQDYQRGLAAQLAGTPGLDRLIYTLGAANEFAIRSFLEQFLFAERSRITDELVSAYLASAQAVNADYAALASLKGALCFDLSRYMQPLTIPTLMIWGAESRFNSPSVGQRLAALNPTAVTKFVAVPNSGVLPHLEHPAVVTGLIHQWLSSTLASSPVLG